MTEPTPVRCPAITHPEFGLADPEDFNPLLVRLAAPAPVSHPEEFPRGTLQPDGRLDLCKQGIGPTLTGSIVAAAVSSPVVRHLLLGTNALGAAGAAAVADALAPGHHVETLYLGCNLIDADGVSSLAGRLADDDTVRALWLKRNPVGDAGVARLAEALATNTSIRTLDLVNVGLSTRGLSVLASVLASRAHRLERLFLGGNGFGPDAVPVLASLIHDAGLRELYLAANHLGDEGVTALAEAAAGKPMVLGLGGNGITPVGAAALAAKVSSWVALDLARPPSERALGARANVVGDDGAAAFAAALSAASGPEARAAASGPEARAAASGPEAAGSAGGTVLRRLDLRRTGIGGRGARLLVDALDGHPTLEYLGLNGGVPRRQRRRAAEMISARPGSGQHPDVRAIASVYR